MRDPFRAPSTVRVARGRAAALACAVAAAPVPEAFGADPADPTLPPVVVTATKAPQPLERTAASVSVLDAGEVDARRVRTLEDLPATVPNLRMSPDLGTGSRGTLVLRGLGNGPGSWDPAATIYVDDVPFNDFFGYASSLFDVERIEVLRGPQGTLYGGFAEAGVIDVRSRLPGETLRGFGAVDVGTRGLWRGTFSLSGPVAGRALRLGVAGTAEGIDGAIRNVVTGERPEERSGAVRVQALFAPTPTFEALGTLFEQRLRHGDGIQLLPLDRAGYDALIAPSGFATRRFEVANDFTGARRADGSGQSLRATWRAPAFDVVAVAARRTFDGPYSYDFDYTPLPAPLTPGFGVPLVSDSSFGSENRSFELRAQSSDRDDLSWVLGASRATQRVDVLAAGVFPSGLGPMVPPGGRAGINDATGTGSNDALFGQATWRVLDGRLGLVAGLRHERAERAGTNRATPLGTPAFEAAVGSSRTLPRLGIDWRPDPTTVAYASVATGWRPGGVNLYADTSTAGGRTPDPIAYGAARTRTVEAGVNLRRPDARLEWSAAVFDTRVEDYQESVQTGTVSGFLANVPRVSIRGAETELRWRPATALLLNAGVGLARARYASYGFAGDLLAGEPLANRPDWNGWLGARWSGGAWTFGADAFGASAFRSTYRFDGTSTRVPGHLVANLSAAYRIGRWTLSALIENVADREYFLNSQFALAGAQVPVGVPGRPRTASLRVRYDL